MRSGLYVLARRRLCAQLYARADRSSVSEGPVALTLVKKTQYRPRRFESVSFYLSLTCSHYIFTFSLCVNVRSSPVERER